MAVHDLPLLPSQQRLLSRIDYLAGFDSRIILLQGPEGAGKTTLLFTYLESQDNQFNQALVQCKAGQTSGQTRHQIISQLLIEPLFDESDRLAETLSRLLPESGARLLIVLDDAQHLDEGLQDELLELVSQLTEHQVVVVMASAEPLSVGFGDDVAIEVAMAPLDLEERHQLLKRLLAQRGEAMMLNEAAIAEQLALHCPFPGQIHAFADTVTAGQSARKPSRFWLLPALALLFALLVAAATAVWVLLFDEGRSNPIERDDVEIAAAVEPQVESPLTAKLQEQAEQDELPTPVSPETIDAEVIERQDVTVVEIDEAQLAQMEQENLKHAVSAEADTPPAEVERIDEPESAPELDVAATVTEQQPEDVQSASDNLPPSEEVPATAVAPVSEPSSVVEPVEAIALLKGAPADYSIQLAAMQNLAALQQFATSQLASQAYLIYRVERKQQTLYILVLGRFGSIELARTAIASLTDAQRQFGPWPKSFVAIDAERLDVIAYNNGQSEL